MTTRRGFLSFLGGALVAAPTIVKAASLMPVRGIVMPWRPNPLLEIDDYGDHAWIEWAHTYVPGVRATEYAAGRIISLTDWGKQLQHDEIIDALRRMVAA